MLWLIGAAMFLQGLVPQFYSVSRAQALLEWEAIVGRDGSARRRICSHGAGPGVGR